MQPPQVQILLSPQVQTEKRTTNGHQLNRNMTRQPESPVEFICVYLDSFVVTKSNTKRQSL